MAILETDHVVIIVGKRLGAVARYCFDTSHTTTPIWTEADATRPGATTAFIIKLGYGAAGHVFYLVNQDRTIHKAVRLYLDDGWTSANDSVGSYRHGLSDATVERILELVDDFIQEP